MANLNLSQFTEKTLVADADWVFVWDTAGAISKKVSRNSLLSGTTADFHLGLADAAAPVAQTLSVQSVVAGTSNTAGVNFSINGSQGTGTGAGGSLLFRTAPAGSSGTTQNALGTALAITAAGNVGIGTTAPSSKLHVAGDSSPSITIDNTLATGASQLLFKNTVVTGDTDGVFLNGSTQTGFGGAGSLNIKATTGPIAFHTATVTNALSVAQNGTLQCGLISSASITVSTTSAISIINRLRINSSGVGLALISTIASDNLDRIMLGGTSAAFPSLKRVGTELQVVIASTAAAMNVAAADADMTFIEDRFRRKGADSPEGVVTAPIGAVYHRTDGGAGTSFYVKESSPTPSTGWVGK
jgi:hypothetical protein